MATFSANAQICRLTLILFLLLLPASSLGQISSPKKRIQKYYEKALLAAQHRDFSEATHLLEEALHADPKFLEAHLQLIQIAQLFLAHEEQIMRLKALINALPDHTAVRAKYYELAQLLANRGKYAEAQPYLDGYFLRVSKPTDQALYLRACLNFAQREIEHRSNLAAPTPLPYPLNILSTQYFPSLTFSGTQLLFTGKKERHYLADEDLYISTKEGSKWQPAQALHFINTLENEGASTLSADGRTLIFTRCTENASRSNCDLYVSSRDSIQSQIWQKPQALTSINSAYWDSQPSLALDASKLYFSSTRPGGYGGKDIWCAEKDSTGQWLRPYNLGKMINTARDEVSPFIHFNNRALYFSSNGHVGMGSFDLFVSEKSHADTFEVSKNLGYPMNNWQDQFGLVLTREGKWAYYVHETLHKGIRSAQLYQTLLPKSMQQKCLAILQGTVQSHVTSKPLRATLSLFQLGATQSTRTLQSDARHGTYALTLPTDSAYVLYVQAQGYLMQTHTFSVTDSLVTQDFYLHPLKKGLILNLPNIFFAVDAYHLDERSRTELNAVVKFLKAHQQLRVEIEGHTDHIGTDIYNQRLSQKRAETVYRFLVKADIESVRLQAKGYGKTRPKAPSTSEANRALNRRIAFRVLQD